MKRVGTSIIIRAETSIYCADGGSIYYVFIQERMRVSTYPSIDSQPSGFFNLYLCLSKYWTEVSQNLLELVQSKQTNLDFK